MRAQTSRKPCRVAVLSLVAMVWCFQHCHGAKTSRINRFYAVASKVGTDKVDSHHYETLYAKYLQPIAGEKLRLLEGGDLLLAAYVCMYEQKQATRSLPCMQSDSAATWLMVRATL